MELAVSKKKFNIYKNLFETLETRIAPLLNGKEPDDEYIFEFQDSSYSTDDDPAMVAMAYIGNVYAICTPDYLTDEQLAIFEEILWDVESDNHIVVFSQRDYDAVKKYLCGKEVDVKMIL